MLISRELLVTLCKNFLSGSTEQLIDGVFLLQGQFMAEYPANLCFWIVKFIILSVEVIDYYRTQGFFSVGFWGLAADNCLQT